MLSRRFYAYRFCCVVVAVSMCGTVILGVSGCSAGRKTNDYLNKSNDPDTARCADGTRTQSKTPDVACASHGGIDQRYDRPY